MREVFFFTDIHGNKRLFDFLRKWCYEQDSECTIIYGGDAADRGEDGFYIMNELLNDPHIIYLYGNHEDLFVKATDAIIGAYAFNDKDYDLLTKLSWGFPIDKDTIKTPDKFHLIHK